jgi:catechol 2,3-dioxygenase-like lactoylglutathione lyase family enzyme
VALPVTSLDASIEFYSSYAGMRVVHRRPEVVWLSDGTRPFVVVLMWLSDGTRPFVVVLIETEKVTHPLRPFAHLGIACESREAVDRLCQRARAENRLLEGPADHGPPVGYWAFLRDPDGHTLEVSHGQEVALTVQAAEPG